MDSTELRSIERIARSVFRCLDNELKSFVATSHERFPNACCDIASSLLLATLEKEGFNNFKLIRGHNPKGGSHVWVENEEFVIDLTSHQFSGFNGPLILISKDEYLLNKSPYYSITEVFDFENWEYYKVVAPAFFDSFYKDYYKKD